MKGSLRRKNFAGKGREARVYRMKKKSVRDSLEN